MVFYDIIYQAVEVYAVTLKTFTIQSIFFEIQPLKGVNMYPIIAGGALGLTVALVLFGLRGVGLSQNEAFAIMAIGAAISVGACFFKWDSIFSGRGERSVSQPRPATSQYSSEEVQTKTEAVHRAPNQTLNNTFQFFWNNGFAVIGSGLLIWSIYSGISALEDLDPMWLWAQCVGCFVASMFCFVAQFGKLKSAEQFLMTGKGAQALWLLASMFIAWFAFMHAERNGYHGWQSFTVGAALFSVFLAMLALFEALSPFGSTLKKCTSGGYGRTVQAIFVFTCVLFISFVVYAVGKSHSFEDFDNIGKWTELSATGGIMAFIAGAFITIWCLTKKGVDAILPVKGR